MDPRKYVVFPVMDGGFGFGYVWITEADPKGLPSLGTGIFTSGPILLASGGGCYPGTNLISEADLLKLGTGKPGASEGTTPDTLYSYCS